MMPPLEHCTFVKRFIESALRFASVASALESPRPYDSATL